jgi:two-component system response regulator PilR (NtrC family)
MRKFAVSHGKQVEEISSGALMHLVNYGYPGNVRELENIIEHAVAVANKNIMIDDDLPVHIRGVPIKDEIEVFEGSEPGDADLFFAKGLSLDVELETHEKCILLGALKRANGVQKRAAEILGINYRSLRHRLEKYGLLNSRNPAFADNSTLTQ